MSSRSRIGTITFAISLIALGVSWFITNVTSYNTLGQVLRFWPVILVILGIEVLVKGERARRSGEEPPEFDFGSMFLLIILVSILGTVGIFRWVSPSWDVGEDIRRIPPLRYILEPGLRETVSERFDKTVQIGAQVKEFSIANPFGDVEVVATEGNELKVSAKIEARGATLAIARDAARATEIHTATEGNIIKVEVFGPAREREGQGRVLRDRRVQVDFVVSVPSGLEVRVNNAFGNVRVNGMRQAVYVENSFGPVEVQNVQGSIDVRNRFGDISVLGAGGSLCIENRTGRVRVDGAGETTIKNNFGEVNASNINGQLDVTNSHGAVEIHKASGYVKVSNQFGAVSIDDPGTGVEVRNSAGEVKVGIVRPITKDCFLSTKFGDISLSLLSGVKADITANTRLGRIRADGPIVVKEGGTRERGISPGSEELSLEGMAIERGTTSESATWKLGGRGPRIRLETENGDITIKTH